MKALVILAVLLGVIAMLLPRTFSTTDLQPSARSVALNFAVFRNAANLYAQKNKPSGIIPQSALELPSGWKPLRSWVARVESGCCYVYGPASGEEIASARVLFQGSLAVGQASGSLLIPDGKTPVPSFVPSGCLLSVVGIN